jgi:glycosidase
MIDDHDQVWRGGYKGRFCSEGNGSKLVIAAVALNLCTLGIPCIYYGTEQGFDGQGGGDEYIREAMFGGEFGAFRSKDRHFFDEDNVVWKDVAKLAQIRRQEITLRRGRQYLREISGDGVHFGLPGIIGAPPMHSVVAWSRLFASEEVLCVINTDPGDELSAWVTVDSDVHPQGSTMDLLCETGTGMGTGTGGGGHQTTPTPLRVQLVNGRAVVKVTVSSGGVVIYK